MAAQQEVALSGKGATDHSTSSGRKRPPPPQEQGTLAASYRIRPPVGLDGSAAYWRGMRPAK